MVSTFYILYYHYHIIAIAHKYLNNYKICLYYQKIATAINDFESEDEIQLTDQAGNSSK